jgi:hypothetical protein
LPTMVEMKASSVPALAAGGAVGSAITAPQSVQKA